MTVTRRFLDDLNEWKVLFASLGGGLVLVWKFLPKIGRAGGIVRKFFHSLAELPEKFTAFEINVRASHRRMEDGLLNLIQNRRLLLDADLVNIHIECDVHGNLTWANRKWTLITGLSIEESTGRGWELAVDPPMLERLGKDWQSATDHQRAFTGNIRYVDRNGKITECRVVASPIRNVDKAIAYYHAVATPLHIEKSLIV